MTQKQFRICTPLCHGKDRNQKNTRHAKTKPERTHESSHHRPEERKVDNMAAEHERKGHVIIFTPRPKYRLGWDGRWDERIRRKEGVRAVGTLLRSKTKKRQKYGSTCAPQHRKSRQTLQQTVRPKIQHEERPKSSRSTKSANRVNCPG